MKKMKDVKNFESDVVFENKKVQMKYKPRKFFLWILLIVAVLGVYGSLHFYGKYQSLKANPNAEAEKETKKLVGVLSTLMELPQNETPTVATISDKEKLKGQAFFDKAENGDILFAYTNSMKAILYRPSVNKIINVAPITINQPQNINEGVERTQPVVSTPTINDSTTSASAIKAATTPIKRK
jgi:hypothetical protein